VHLLAVSRLEQKAALVEVRLKCQQMETIRLAQLSACELKIFMEVNKSPFNRYN